MFFVLSKLLDLAFSPLWWALGLAALARVPRVRSRWPRLARGAPWAGLAALLLASTQCAQHALWHALERGAQRTERASVTYDAVVVLGGMVDEAPTRAYGPPSYGQAVDRLLAGFEALRTGHARYAVLSGANATGDPRYTEAAVLARQLAAWGVERERLLEEPRARNTYENAVESAALLRARGLRRVLLVTSAAHMPRALGCFRAAASDLEVDAWPVDYRTASAWPPALDVVPRAAYLGETELALREFAGRAVYRARGYAR